MMVFKYLNLDKIKMLCDKSNDTMFIKEYIKNIYKNLLGNDYQFQDYIFVIKKSSVHTYHRNTLYYNENYTKILNKDTKNN